MPEGSITHRATGTVTGGLRQDDALACENCCHLARRGREQSEERSW